MMPARASTGLSVPAVQLKVNSTQADRIAARLKFRSRVIYDTSLSAEAVRLFLILDDHAGMTGVCWPGQERLMTLTGMKRSQFFRVLAELRCAYVSVEKDGRKANYTLGWVPRVAPIQREKVPQVAPKQVPVAGPIAPCPYMNLSSIELDRSNDVVSDEDETQKTAWMAAQLRRYPGAMRSLGHHPDEAIARRCLDAVGWDIAQAEAVFVALVRSRAAPSESWGWFPAVMAQRMRTRGLELVYSTTTRANTLQNFRTERHYEYTDEELEAAALEQEAVGAGVW